MDYLKVDDFILKKNKKGNMTGGMLFNNFFQNNNIPVMVGGGGKKNKMNELTIPMGLVLLNEKIKEKKEKLDLDNLMNNTLDIMETDIVSDSLYDSLLGLYQETKNNKEVSSAESKGKKGGKRRKKRTRKKAIKMKLKNKSRKL